MPSSTGWLGCDSLCIFTECTFTEQLPAPAREGALPTGSPAATPASLGKKCITQGSLQQGKASIFHITGGPCKRKRDTTKNTKSLPSAPPASQEDSAKPKVASSKKSTPAASQEESTKLKVTSDKTSATSASQENSAKPKVVSASDRKSALSASQADSAKPKVASASDKKSALYAAQEDSAKPKGTSHKKSTPPASQEDSAKTKVASDKKSAPSTSQEEPAKEKEARDNSSNMDPKKGDRESEPKPGSSRDVVETRTVTLTEIPKALPEVEELSEGKFSPSYETMRSPSPPPDSAPALGQQPHSVLREEDLRRVLNQFHQQKDVGLIQQLLDRPSQVATAIAANKKQQISTNKNISTIGERLGDLTEKLSAMHIRSAAKNSREIAQVLGDLRVEARHIAQASTDLSHNTAQSSKAVEKLTESLCELGRNIVASTEALTTAVSCDTALLSDEPRPAASKAKGDLFPPEPSSSGISLARDETTRRMAGEQDVNWAQFERGQLTNTKNRRDKYPQHHPPSDRDEGSFASRRAQERGNWSRQDRPYAYRG